MSPQILKQTYKQTDKYIQGVQLDDDAGPKSKANYW